MKENLFKYKLFLFLSIFCFFTANSLSALSLTDISSELSDVFYNTYDENEGTTTFRSLLIPFGGKAESLGEAFTGLCDDTSFLSYNPAASCIQKETQFSIYHNSWIADSKIETLAYTARADNFGAGVSVSCFYVPFSEYNYFGTKVNSSYYTETTSILNLSYNFLAGYDFKGLSIGANIKTGWKGMPDYTDNNSNSIVQFSGLSQSSLGIMADAGIMLQFNLFKFFSSRDPNLKIGLSAQNFGVVFTGLGTSKVTTSDSLPAMVNAGLSLSLIKPITFSLDFKQPLNLQNPSVYLKPYLCSGISIKFTDFLIVLAGFELKGGNPKINAGFEAELFKIRLNVNYSIDFTSSVTPLNKLSLSTKILLGDNGRSVKSDKVDELYNLGLMYYSEENWTKAIECWNEALKINKRLDPAILGIKSAQSQIKMFEQIKESLLLDN